LIKIASGKIHRIMDGAVRKVAGVLRELMNLIVKLLQTMGV